MNILFDISHPKNFHGAKHVINSLNEKGNKVFVIARDKECTLKLLKNSKIEYFNRGKGSSSIIGRIFNSFLTIYIYLKYAIQIKPNLIISFGSPYSAFVSFIIHKPNIVFDDTDHNFLVQFLYKPFSNCIIVPSCFQDRKGKKHIKINSYIELAYLHPQVFKPSINVFELLKIPAGNKYIVFRFVSWKAIHDIGERGLTDKMKIKIANEFLFFGKIFISSEVELPSEIQQYALKIPPQYIHDIIANAALFISESSTMAAEAAVLGIPSIYISNSKRGYTNELSEKYNLVYCFKNNEEDFQNALLKGKEIISNPEIKEQWQQKRQKMLSEKMNAGTFFTWFIENYPESVDIMKEYPDYQYKFR